ncbi:MAG: DUF3810 domain-containing protein [Oscillospiraceae bacterium]|nr:DUF3810 domain-containing protein [Oscillospiraceae bacterium]MBQ6878009.1 DUF3810 domain-containing protein [Oscillospiraceae bacterium]
MKLKSLFKSPYFYFIMLVPLGFLLLAAARFIPGFADGYYNVVYRNLGGIFGSITGIFPFSLMEAGICSLVVLVFVWLVKLVLKGKEDTETVLRYFKSVLMKMISIACAVFFLFCVFSGTNYYREGFAEKNGLETKKSSVTELYELCEHLLNEATESGSKLYRGEDNLTVFDEKNFSMAREAKAEFEKFAGNYDFMKMGFGKFGTPKPVFFSEVMSYLLISGVYSPYTFEANVCTSGPDFLRGATMMHEQCHLRGFMNEAEANFMAYLACINSDSEYFRYSGNCFALLYSMNALYSADYELWYKLRVQYPEYISADMASQNEYVSAHDTKVAEVSDKVNDTYLKLNDQQDGVRSYGKMVDLLLAYRRSL